MHWIIRMADHLPSFAERDSYKIPTYRHQGQKNQTRTHAGQVDPPSHVIL